MTKKKIDKFLLALGLVFIIFILLVVLITQKRGPELKTYRGIDIFEKNTNSLLGSITVENDRVVYQTDSYKLEQLLSQEVPTWQEKEFKYKFETGDVNKTLTMIEKTTKLGKDDFFIGLWVHLNDNWNSEYDFHLIE